MGPKTRYRKIKYLLLNFMPLLPSTLPSLRPCSHASRLPRLGVMLPLVLRRVSFSSSHHLPFGGTFTCPPLIVLPPLFVPLFFSCAVASHPPQLFVVSPLVMPPLPICQRLHLSLHRCFSLHPFCAFCLAGCHVASHHVAASCPLAPPALVASLPLVAPLLCLLSFLAGCRDG
jgi:hypothetical protein